MTDGKSVAQKNGKVFFGPIQQFVDITVTVINEQQGGALPVIVEWPLFRCRFPSLVDARNSFGPFGQFRQVPNAVRDLVKACLDELGA